MGPVALQGTVFRFLTIVASLTFALTVVEVAVRIWVLRKENANLVVDQQLGWDSEPSVREIGMLSKRLVLFIGDSFTQNCRWPHEVVQCLKIRGLATSGLECGVSGFGTYQELKKLRHILGRTTPNAVVIQFYCWNDLRDNWAWPALGYNPDMLARPYLNCKGQEIWAKYPWKWMDGFKVMSYFRKRSLIRAWQRADRHMRGEGIDAVASRHEALVAGLCADQAWQPFYLPEKQEGAFVDGAWQVTENVFANIFEACASRKIPLLVLALDAPFTVDEDKWRFIHTKYPTLDPKLPLRRLKRFLENRDIHAVFPQASLLEWSQTTGQNAYDGDSEGLTGHLTPGGEEIVAKEVAQAVEKILAGR